jgi:TonB-dependent starch-binding outer membrane protein SusC
MRHFFTITAALLLTIAGFTALGQNKAVIINGKVTSFEESLPLEGVNVSVKGGKNITGTQADGSFTLAVSPEDKILLVSLEGYETKEIKIIKVREYDIVLKRTNKGF